MPGRAGGAIQTTQPENISSGFPGDLRNEAIKQSIYLRTASSGLADTQLRFNPLGVTMVYGPWQLCIWRTRSREDVLILGPRVFPPANGPPPKKRLAKRTASPAA